MTVQFAITVQWWVLVGLTAEISELVEGLERGKNMLGEQGWRSGESTRLPPMWAGFDS